MTRVVFYKKQARLCGFQVSGHAGYSQEGGDVVCAGVSSAVMLVANGITEIVGVDCALEVTEPRISLMLPREIDKQKEEQARLFLEAFRLHILSLQEQYGDYLKSDVMEV